MDAVNTKKASRRELDYTSFADVSADLDRIQASHDAGTLRHSGNWSSGQVLEHCAVFMRCALDGFPKKAPAPIRFIAQLFWKKKALTGAPPPAGIPTVSFLEPNADTNFSEGMSALREQIARVDDGERFTHPSGLFGELTHDEWTIMQLGHLKLHLSFLHPE